MPRRTCFPLSKSNRAGAAQPVRLILRLRSDLQDPLFRNAYALLANALGTSFLGLVYWVTAARFYSPTFVGASSALIATLLLASTVAQLNLGSVLARFLPKAGSNSRRLVTCFYLLAGSVALLIGLAAMPWIARMGERLGLSGAYGRVWIVAAVVVWCIFALQDHVLTGLRKAIWVPGENAVFGLLKVVLLVALAAKLPALGIFASWTIPMALMLVPINLLIFGRFLPRHMSDSRHTARLNARHIGRFAAFDYLGLLLNLASSQLLPVLVATRIGAEANGYFYIAWVVMTTFDLALVSVTSSLTVEGSHDERSLPALVSAMIPRMLAGGALILAVIVIAAPQILAIFGPAYSTNATGLLRMLAIGLLPRGAIVLWMSAARVQNKVKAIVGAQGAASAIVLGLSVLLMSRFNILGVGIAFLIGQAAVALALLPALRRLIISPPDPAGPVPGGDQAPEQLLESVSTDQLSVVVPVRNAEAMVEDCLASVVRANPAEIIVVDGLSTDSTLQIAQRFPVRIISDEGLGLPVARTRGAAIARSRWVALVDADLVVDEGCLEKLLQEFVEGGYVGLQAGLRSVSGDGYWGRALVNHHRYGFSRRWFGLGLTIFERDRLLDVGFDPRFESGEDIELRLRLKDSGARVGVSSTTIAIHRFGDDLSFAKRQWASDGSGLARVIRKRGPKAIWLAGIPLVSALWGVVLSLMRIQPQWVPYFFSYLAGNYVAMVQELRQPATPKTSPEDLSVV